MLRSFSSSVCGLCSYKTMIILWANDANAVTRSYGIMQYGGITLIRKVQFLLVLRAAGLKSKLIGK